MEVHGALKGGLANLPWGKRDGLELAKEVEDEEESVYRGEGTTSWTALSDDFCSREISEFEKLLCLQIREKNENIIFVKHELLPSFHFVSGLSDCTYLLVLTLPVSHCESKR